MTVSSYVYLFASVIVVQGGEDADAFCLAETNKVVLNLIDWLRNLKIGKR